MASEAFSPAGCPGHIPITSDHTKILEAVGTLTYDLSLTQDSDAFWDALDEDGGNLRISNEDATFAYSLSPAEFSWANREGILHFDSSPVISTSVNRTWKLWPVPGASYPDLSDPLGSYAVWSNDVLVLSMRKNLADLFTDLTANGHHGATAAGTTTNVAGKLGTATDFTSARIECGTGVDDTLGSGFTLECWINPDTLSGTSGIMGTYNGQAASNADRSGIQWRYSGGQIDLMFFDSSPNAYIGRATASNILTTGSWQKLQATWDGTFSPSGFNIYRNGVQVDSSNLAAGVVDSFEQSALPFTLGAVYFSSGPQYMDGKLDFVRVSAGARSADYAATRYNNENSPATFWSTGEWVPSASAFRPAWHVQQRRLNRMAC